MLTLIGLGLASEQDLSIRALNILKESHHIFLESYTSKSNVNLNLLEDVIGKTIKIADREFTESNNNMIDLAQDQNISLIIIGTPMFATTHTDIIIRAKERGIETNVLHNSSIMNVMGCYGLYSYSFGRTISIPFFQENWKPTSFYDYFKINFENNMHTLCLLDIKVKEIKKEMMFSEVKEYEEPRFMTPNLAIKQLLHCETLKNDNILNGSYKIFVISRFGTDNEKVVYDSIDNILEFNFGEPLHSLILPCKMDTVEKENVYEYFKTT